MFIKRRELVIAELIVAEHYWYICLLGLLPSVSGGS
jgi:hypothetical protein